jgi:predicted porin
LLTTKDQAMAMMIKSLKIVLFISVIWAFVTIEANAQTTDFRARIGVKAQTDITQKLSVSLEYEHRFDNYLTCFDQALLEPSVSYELFKDFKLGAEWRFMIDQNLKRNIKYKQRAAIFVKYQCSIDDFDVSIRTALQYGFDELTLSVNSSQNLVNRNTIEIEYNWFGTKFKPFASYEFFYHINDPNGGIINQWRAKAGTAYRITKKSELSVYYLFENEINVAYPVDANVIGVGFSHKF